MSLMNTGLILPIGFMVIRYIPLVKTVPKVFRPLNISNLIFSLLLEGKFGFGIKMGNYECCNLAITYCVLACLLILGDDLSRVNRSALIEGLKFYQKEDGRYVQSF